MFDSPRTRAMVAFLAKEGPQGTGRIVGLSHEGPDGVFLYTESAKWCDDNGSGTFRGDNETGAIQAFNARVKEGNGDKENPQPKSFTVDMTPTWEGVAHMIELGLVRGNPEGQRIAKEELNRMAKLADLAIAQREEVKAVVEMLEHVTEDEDAGNDDILDAVIEAISSLKGDS